MVWIVIACIFALAFIICLISFLSFKKRTEHALGVKEKYDELDKALEQKYKDMEAALQKQYQNLEQGFQTKIIEDQAKAREAFTLQQTQMAQQLAKQQEDNLKAIEGFQHDMKYYEDLRAAVVSENIRMEQVRLQANFYKVTLDDIEKSDIEKLRPVATVISKPVILYKLIYEVYYKPKLEQMFKQVLSTVDMEGGIYKITNVNNNKVYIGRATNYLTRWRQHAKCGTGADNGAKVNLRLYEAMMAEGVENFTFEVIDPCAAEDQPAREKYWVEFYHSIEYGYNDKGGG